MPEGVVGRDPELEAAARFLQALERGPAALVFEGEPGIGKTTVWKEVIAQADARSFTVLRCRPVESEVPLAFAALSDLLETAADDHLRELPEPQQHALSVALLRKLPGSDGLDQRAIGAATLGILRICATKAPVVLAIDDLQWLDRSSTRVLQFVVRRLAGSPVGVLACQRRATAPSTTLQFDELEESSVFRHRLSPMSLAALQRIMKERLARTFSHRTLVQIHRASGGNPFFALEIARGLPGGELIGPALPVPDTLRELIARRMQGLSTATQQTLLVVAALSAPTIAVVVSAVGRSGDGVMQNLETAATAGIIDLDGPLVRFTHPLFAAVLYSTAPTADRRRIHRALAGAVSEIEEQARHLALGAAEPDAAVAASLEAAANHARRRGAPEAAAELAEHARSLTPAQDSDASVRRTIQAARYHFHAGELPAAATMLEGVLDDALVGPPRAEALHLMSAIRSYEQSQREGLRLNEQALQHAGDDAARRAAIELDIAFQVQMMGDYPSALYHARRAAALAERVQDRGLIAAALAVVEVAGFVVGLGLDVGRLERALDLEDPNDELQIQMRPTLIAGYLALYMGEIDRSVRLLAPLRKRILERGQESDLPYVASYLAWAECWRGNLSLAETLGAESIAFAERLGMVGLGGFAHAFAAVVAAYAGDERTARARAGRARLLASETGTSLATLWSDWAMAILAVSLGDARAADEALGPITAVVEQYGLPEPVRVPSLPDEIEALIALGQLDRAERLLTILEDSARRLDRTWALAAASRCRGLLLAARGNLGEASEAAAQAVERGEGLELRLDLARSLLVAGQIERRRRRKRDAATYLAKSLDIFERSGAKLWAEHVRREIDRLGMRRLDKDQLTTTERRVAEFAAAGNTNRQVAAALFISPKTVEANLARAYSKLGIHSRAELGARLSPASPSADTEG
jgi:DNA-binding CsgD family transcriptional regulator